MAKKTQIIKLYNDKEVLYYDDDKHIYWDDNGQLYGVTSIMNIADKPALVNWAVNLTLSKITELKEHIQDNFIDVISEARRAHYEASKKARELGTRVHAVADHWFSDDKLGLISEMLKVRDEEERLALSALIKFFQTQKVERELGERKIKSLKYRYAGTADFIGKINGDYVVADYKTSSAIYPEYFVQTSAYASALEEEGFKIDKTMIIRIGKDGVLEMKADENWKDKMPIFLAHKEIYEWKMKMKDLKNGKTTLEDKLDKPKVNKTNKK